MLEFSSDGNCHSWEAQRTEINFEMSSSDSDFSPAACLSALLEQIQACKTKKKIYGKNPKKCLEAG